jgi:broad specificity phosphatase PhoE
MRIQSIGRSVAAIVVSVLVSIPASARAGGIKKRAENQQDRIAQGVKSGQLTARETARLEGKESKLNTEVRDMRQLDGGKLTSKDRAVVNQQQNRLSRNIYTQKHDAQTQGSGTGEIAQRKENQQDRIAQGVASGSLTARETARLESKESALNQETRDMRALDGGKLTPKDKAAVNQQQNRLSEGIYDQKHDAQTQPPQ